MGPRAGPALAAPFPSSRCVGQKLAPGDDGRRVACGQGLLGGRARAEGQDPRQLL